MDSDPGLWALLPPLVAIGLAFYTRQVLFALFFGIVAAGVVLWATTGNVTDANIMSRFLVPALSNQTFVTILVVYFWCLGGILGLWEQTGAARHFGQWVSSRFAKGPRSSLFVTWLLGLVFHQGGTVSTVIVGTTTRPIADRHRVSHEELSYVVDSTGSPVASLIPFNAWPAYVAGIVVGTVPLFSGPSAGSDAIRFFFSSIPYNFYAWVAVIFTLLFALGLMPWVGKKMAAARHRARTTGELNRVGSEPLSLDEELASVAHEKGYKPTLIDFFLPVIVLICVATIPNVLFGADTIREAFLMALVAQILWVSYRGLSLHGVIEAIIKGCESMTLGAIVISLAVTMGYVTRELDTAGQVIQLLGGGIDPKILPVLLCLVCMVVAFATGTSLGTYAVVFPVAMPLAWSVMPDPVYLQICFGAVLGGGAYGDQCSPISDTTILASMFTGCDLMDHVQTQLPLATLAAGLGALLSTLAVCVLL